MRHRRLKARARDRGDRRRDLGGGQEGRLKPGKLAIDRRVFRQWPDDEGRGAAVAQILRGVAVEFDDQIAALAGQHAGIGMGLFKAAPGLHDQMQVGLAHLVGGAGDLEPPGQRVPFAIRRADENLVAQPDPEAALRLDDIESRRAFGPGTAARCRVLRRGGVIAYP